MTKYLNKKTILFVSIMLLLLVTVGVSLAYIFDITPSLKNVFTPSKVSCEVIQNTGTSTEVQIKNTGDTDAYIRVKLVINWMSEGNRVWAIAPVEGTDYTLIPPANDSLWILGNDGYYYYSKPIAPTELTNTLVKYAPTGTTPPTGTDGTTYYFSVEVVASAIQAKPTTSVEQWGVSVDQDGNIRQQGE